MCSCNNKLTATDVMRAVAAGVSVAWAVIFRLEISRNFKTKTRHAGHFSRNGQQSHFSYVEILQYLRPDTVIPQIRSGGTMRTGFHRHDTRHQFRRAFPALEQHDHTGPGVCNYL